MRILVATDLTERSDRALDRAVRLASELEAELTVVHVVDDGLPEPVARDQRREALRVIAEHLQAANGGTAAGSAVDVHFGSAWEEIIRQSMKCRAELIVLGIPRPAVLRDLLRGSTAERIIRNSPLPILVVTHRPSARYADLVVGTDFSVPSRRAIEFALRVAPDARVHLVHAYEIPFRGLIAEPSRRTTRKVAAQFEAPIQSEMAAFARALPEAAARGIICSTQEGLVHEVLRRQVRKHRAPLLVLGTHGRTGLARAFMGSTAESVLGDPPCDVLVAKGW